VTDGPLVTIVTPSLNQGRFIGEAVESVLGQTYPAIEYVVLDAGSTDETHDVLRKFGSRVQWKVESDNGQSQAINRGWRRGAGTILAWLCADDLLEPNAVATAVEALLARPDAGAAYGRGTNFTDTEIEPQDHTAPFHLWRLINMFDFVFQPAAFFRRDAVEAVGWLDESLHYSMDWDLLIRLGLRQPLVPVDALLARARIHVGAKTSTGGLRRHRELRRVIRRYADERRPPSYWFYGLETFKHAADAMADKLSRRSPRIGRSARDLVDRANTSVACRTFLKADDWWPDGWACASVDFLVPPGDEPVRLVGAIAPDLAPQTLSVAVDGSERCREVLPAGPFSITVPGTTGGTRDVTRVRVTADRWKPIHHPWGRDAIRRVAYRLDAIERRSAAQSPTEGRS